MSQRPLAFTNVRIVDPESRRDGPGALLVQDGVIAEVIKRVKPLALLYLPFGAQPGRTQRPASDLAEARQA